MRPRRTPAPEEDTGKHKGKGERRKDKCREGRGGARSVGDVGPGSAPRMVTGDVSALAARNVHTDDTPDGRSGTSPVGGTAPGEPRLEWTGSRANYSISGANRFRRCRVEARLNRLLESMLGSAAGVLDSTQPP